MKRVHCSVREHIRDPAFPGIHHIGGSDVQKPAKDDRDNDKAGQKGRMTFPCREELSAKPIAKRAPTEADPVRGAEKAELGTSSRVLSESPQRKGKGGSPHKLLPLSVLEFHEPIAAAHGIAAA